METGKTRKKPASAPKEQKAKADDKLHDANGKFKKGHEKKGGRKAGTPNRASNVRDRLREQVEPFINEISLNLLKVQKEEGTAAMMALMEKFMPYFMPKYSSLAINADQDRPVDEEQMLMDLDARYTKKELSINFKTMIVVDNDAASGDYDPDEDPDFDLSQLQNATE